MDKKTPPGKRALEKTIIDVCITERAAVGETKEKDGSPTSSTDSQPSENGASKSKSLHITHSVYIRHIPAKISADDIIEASHSGSLLRTSISTFFLCAPPSFLCSYIVGFVFDLANGADADLHVMATMEFACRCVVPFLAS